MKLKKFGEMKLNEGLRVNPKTLMLEGEYSLDEIINELQSLYDEDDGIKLGGTVFTLDIESEVFYMMRELREWKKAGWNSIEGFGSEWIPKQLPNKLNK